MFFYVVSIFVSLFGLIAIVRIEKDEQVGCRFKPTARAYLSPYLVTLLVDTEKFAQLLTVVNFCKYFPF